MTQPLLVYVQTRPHSVLPWFRAFSWNCITQQPVYCVLAFAGAQQYTRCHRIYPVFTYQKYTINMSKCILVLTRWQQSSWQGAGLGEGGGGGRVVTLRGSGAHPISLLAAACNNTFKLNTTIQIIGKLSLNIRYKCGQLNCFIYVLQQKKPKKHTHSLIESDIYIYCIFNNRTWSGSVDDPV